MADSATVKTSWADEVEVEELEPPKVDDYVDEDGIRVTIEYHVNDQGKKMKVWCLFRLQRISLNTALRILRLRGRSGARYGNRLSSTPWPRGNNGKNSVRKKVDIQIFPLVNGS